MIWLRSFFFLMWLFRAIGFLLIITLSVSYQRNVVFFLIIFKYFKILLEISFLKKISEAYYLLYKYLCIS